MAWCPHAFLGSIAGVEGNLSLLQLCLLVVTLVWEGHLSRHKSISFISSPAHAYLSLLDQYKSGVDGLSSHSARLPVRLPAVCLQEFWSFLKCSLYRCCCAYGTISIGALKGGYIQNHFTARHCSCGMSAHQNNFFTSQNVFFWSLRRLVFVLSPLK